MRGFYLRTYGILTRTHPDRYLGTYFDMYVYIIQCDGCNTRFHLMVRITVRFEVTVTPNPRHHRDYPGRHTAGGQAGGTSVYRYSDCQNTVATLSRDERIYRTHLKTEI